jgi:hypothetical protein
MARPTRKHEAKTPSKHLELVAPLVKLLVCTHCFTGIDSETRPGVSFSADTTEPIRRVAEDGSVHYRFPLGVISRTQVRHLRDLLDEFLADFPGEG